jgi:hypothetical protein
MVPLPCSPCVAGHRAAGGACRCHAGGPAAGKASVLIVAGRFEAPRGKAIFAGGLTGWLGAPSQAAGRIWQLTGWVVSNR